MAGSNTDSSTPENRVEKKYEWLDDEWKSVEPFRAMVRGANDLPRTGIALSGGGIRSAVVGLGALQALASKDLLKHFDYLSSVSGGGYVACSLQYWWHKGWETVTPPLPSSFGTRKNNFPFGTASPSFHPESADPPDAPTTESDEKYNRSAEALQEKLLAFLRLHGSYLIPGDGITIWSGVVVVLRTLLLNLLIWTAIGAGFFYLTLQLGSILDCAAGAEHQLPQCLNNPSFVASPLPEHLFSSRSFHLHFSIFQLLVWISYGLIIVILLLAVLLAAFSTLQSGEGPRWGLKRFASTFLTAAFCIGTGVVSWNALTAGGAKPDSSTWIWVGCISAIGVAFFARLIVELLRPGTTTANYSLRRFFEVWAAKAVLPAIFLFAFGAIPIIGESIAQANLFGGFGVLAFFSGFASSIYSHFVLVRNVVPSLAGRIFASAGACAFLYGITIGSYLIASLYFREEVINNTQRGLLTLLIIAAWVLSVISNINNIGLHRFYRDRLMEAFMPDNHTKTSASPSADGLLMTDLWRRESVPMTPYPIINCNIILTNDNNRKYSARGGDNFIITPLYCGSEATGWERTSVHVDRLGPITLATAMAVSGAATNAHSAYLGTGLTRDPFVSTLMTLLNIRLGIWFANPMYWFSNKPRRFLNYWHPVMTYGLLPRGYRSNSHFVELSDGGHFENLGIYELIRRRAQVILVIDAEADKETSFAAFVSAVRRISEDFGVEIDPGPGPDRIFATTALGYPHGVLATDWPYFVVPVEYPVDNPGDAHHGCIIYIKAAFIKNLSFVAKGYRAKNSDFPHQTTVDQFFEPEQFEAYRELGYLSVLQAIKDLKLQACINDPEKIVEVYNQLVSERAGQRAVP